MGILICEMIGGFTPFQNKHEASNPKDLVKLILTDDPYSRPDLMEIKDHTFFKELNWLKLKKRLVNPPFVPEDQSKLTFDQFMAQQDHNADMNGDRSESAENEGVIYNNISELERIPEDPTDSFE